MYWRHLPVLIIFIAFSSRQSVLNIFITSANLIWVINVHASLMILVFSVVFMEFNNWFFFHFIRQSESQRFIVLHFNNSFLKLRILAIYLTARFEKKFFKSHLIIHFGLSIFIRLNRIRSGFRWVFISFLDDLHAINDSARNCN